MSAAYKCDWCKGYFEQGFKGGWKKTLMKGQMEFFVTLKVEKSPHICSKKCWSKFCKLLYDDLRVSYIEHDK